MNCFGLPLFSCNFSICVKSICENYSEFSLSWVNLCEDWAQTSDWSHFSLTLLWVTWQNVTLLRWRSLALSTSHLVHNECPLSLSLHDTATKWPTPRWHCSHTPFVSRGIARVPSGARLESHSSYGTPDAAPIMCSDLSSCHE
jgi:hypothetical protein